MRLLLVLLLAVAAFNVRAHAQSTDTILILDASGSMWGQVDGQTKISAARAAVDTILGKWKPSDRIGLIAYGHRSKGDCKDIELLAPVSTFDPAGIKSAVKALNPKGKTPIADALRMAANTLKSTENKATVVLVSDGIETCVVDPCAVAADLKKAGVGFTAHVVGFDVADPVARGQLQCIARATGGVYLDARNASGLESALGRAVEAAQGAKVQTEAPAKAEPDPFKGKNIRGAVRLAPGLDPVTDPALGWTVFKPNPDGSKGEFVVRFDGSPFANRIDPGDYVMEVEYGQVSKLFSLKVERGKPAVLDVVLDAGYVTSDGSIAGSGAKAEDSTWDMLDSKGEWMATEYRRVPRFILPAGDYTLRLTRGNTKSEKPFSITAGDSINVSLILDAGKLLVSGRYSEAGPKIDNGLSVDVRYLPKTPDEKGEWVATTYDALSKFDLPTGSYDVVVSVGAASRTIRAEVKSGADTRLDVNIDAGVLGLKTGDGKAIEIFKAERDINNERKHIHTGYEPDLNLALNAGSYVVIVEYGPDKKVEKPFTITAGKRATVEVQP
ncbi:MAG: VWA domain-containing protein [Pseudolabrys sp.]|nr:VWA domain-containing protein [Pseudolabrys sp.]MDP2298283.1 VWA domain-containing protein [Pseudolabrys sp.]